MAADGGAARVLAKPPTRIVAAPPTEPKQTQHHRMRRRRRICFLPNILSVCIGRVLAKRSQKSVSPISRSRLHPRGSLLQTRVRRSSVLRAGSGFRGGRWRRSGV